jgi:lipoteichoic acid synthase
MNPEKKSLLLSFARFVSGKIACGFSKIAHHFHGVCRNTLFRFVLLCILVKLLFFTSLTGLGIESTVPACGAILAILAPVFLIKHERPRLVYLVLCDSVFSFLFFTHALYFKYFGDFASLYDLPQLGQLKSVVDMLPGMITVEAFFFVDLPFLPFIQRGRLEQEHSWPAARKGFLVLICLGALLNIHTFYDASKSRRSFFASTYYRYDFALRLGIIDYQVDDAYDYLDGKLKKASVTQEDIGWGREWIEEKERKRESRNDLTGAGKGMNLVVIQVESMQSFAIGLTHDGREVTPNLNRLAREGLYFHNIFDQTAAGNSSDAVLLANASLYPARRGAASFLYAQDHFDSLPKVLAGYGYATAVIHAYKRGFWNYDTFERGLGFRTRLYEKSFVKTEELGGFLRGLSDKAFFFQASEKIARLPEPFYVSLRTLSTHNPFAHITQEIDNFPLGALDGAIIGYYLRAMNYVDGSIGTLLQKLSDDHLLSHTIIVVYGDHRARLPHRELERVGITDLRDDRKILLIISMPRRVREHTRDTVGGLIDVAPTICNILGIDSSGHFFFGKDLGNGGPGFAIFRDGSYVSGGASINESFVLDQLKISDLILEKDMVSLVRLR